MSRACRATKPAGLGRTWACTRERGHRGLHRATDVLGVVVHTWRGRSA